MYNIIIYYNFFVCLLFCRITYDALWVLYKLIIIIIVVFVFILVPIVDVNLSVLLFRCTDNGRKYSVAIHWRFRPARSAAVAAPHHVFKHENPQTPLWFAPGAWAAAVGVFEPRPDVSPHCCHLGSCSAECSVSESDFFLAHILFSRLDLAFFPAPFYSSFRVRPISFRRIRLISHL